MRTLTSVALGAAAVVAAAAASAPAQARVSIGIGLGGYPTTITARLVVQCAIPTAAGTTPIAAMPTMPTTIMAQCSSTAFGSTVPFAGATSTAGVSSTGTAVGVKAEVGAAEISDATIATESE